MGIAIVPSESVIMLPYGDFWPQNVASVQFFGSDHVSPLSNEWTSPAQYSSGLRRSPSSSERSSPPYTPLSKYATVTTPFSATPIAGFRSSYRFVFTTVTGSDHVCPASSERTDMR